MCKLYSLILIFIFATVQSVTAQTVIPYTDPFKRHVPVPSIPTPSTILSNQQGSSSYNPVYYPNLPTTQENNIAIMREVEERAVYNAEMRRQNDIRMLIENSFGPAAGTPGTEHYYDAYDEINKMLKGEIPLDLGRSIFLVEDAYHENKYAYHDYLKGIQAAIDICNQKIEEEKLDKDDNTTKNMMLFRFMSDTLKFRDKETNKELYHYPVKYNYDDYRSIKSFDSHFVTTLMRTGLGQCHSMPLYYLVLAEKMNAEAYWAFSPRHTFVKIQDEKGSWYNIELTCKAILSDAHYMNSSFIKAEAIRNRIYMEPMDKSKVIAEMLNELAWGYFEKYGYDDFYLQCTETAKKHVDNELNAVILQHSYQKRLTLVLADLLRAPHPDIMKEVSPGAYKHYEKLVELNNRLEELGYEDLPEDVYEIWLKHIEREKKKSEKLPSIFVKKAKE